MHHDEQYWKRPDELDTSVKKSIWAKVIRKRQIDRLTEHRKLISIKNAKSKKIKFLHEYSPGYQEIRPNQVETIFPYTTR